MDTKEKILDYIRINGPSLPIPIAKKLEDNSFFISAHLSEMKDMGKIRISHIKIGGGSPLYFIPGQEPQLERFADNLGDKEKKVHDLLKEKKVLMDSSLVPVFRAAIRTIKDFSVPLTVSVNGSKVLFWKWRFLPSAEAESVIKNMLGVKKEEIKEKIAEENPEPEKKTEKEPEKKTEKKQEEKPEEQQQLKEEKPEEKKKEKAEPPKVSDFIEEVKKYFSDNRIAIIEENTLRKTDAEYIVEVPSPLGSLKYFVKAKSKKKVNDGDLSSVFVQSQTKRLPVIFLSKGDLTKKAQEMLDTEFKGMKFKKI